MSNLSGVWHRCVYFGHLSSLKCFCMKRINSCFFLALETEVRRHFTFFSCLYADTSTSKLFHGYDVQVDIRSRCVEHVQQHWRLRGSVPDGTGYQLSTSRIGHCRVPGQ